MRSIEEIQHRLEEAEAQLEHVKNWATTAYEKYRRDKKLWGEADYGEVDTAHDELSILTTEVNTLKWVLHKT